jgi:hypothetical protein
LLVANPPEGATYYYDTSITITGQVRNIENYIPPVLPDGTGPLDDVKSLSLTATGPPAHAHTFTEGIDLIEGLSTGTFSYVIDTSGMTGSQTLKVTAVDQGDRATEKNISMLTDGMAPVFSSVTPADLSYYGDSVTVTGNVVHSLGGVARIDSASLTWDLFPSAQNGTFTINGSGDISMSDIDMSSESGHKTLTLSAADKNGDATQHVIQLLYDDEPPTVVDVTSDDADGLYGIGATITIKVVFSENIEVASGTPTLRLQLDSGTRNVNCDPVPGAATDRLLFPYTIQSGDERSDLDYSSTTSLSGDIDDVFGNEANLTLATPGLNHSLGYHKELEVDGVRPSITSVVTADTDSDGFIDQLIITFDENVDASTAADAEFKVADVDGEDATDDGSPNDPVIWVNVNDGDPDLHTAATPNLDIDANAIEDLAGNGNANDDTNTPTDKAGPAIINAVAGDDDSTKEAGDTVTITFSETTNKHPISSSSSNIDTVLVLDSNSWLDGDGDIASAVWDADGDELVVTLSDGLSLPTITTANTITLSSDIEDATAGNTASSAVFSPITGGF